jgi:metallo-beta-lactamase family protein
LPLLAARGYDGPIYTHAATVDLCAILLEDAAYLNEKDAEWENRKRERKGLPPVEPLYTRSAVHETQRLFRPVEYDKAVTILDGVRLTLHDAGHILGSAIAQFELSEHGRQRTLVVSGDLGQRGAPILRDPAMVAHADLVVMESTYGDRQHRPWEQTWQEMGEIISRARSDKGNILIPAFAVGRTQELLYVFSQHYDQWGLQDWQVFLDSPMAIEATEVYARHARVYDARAFLLPNLRISRSSEDSALINRIRSGAIIIAGSGMCTGGRITHHLKHNVWRREAHVMIVGFQAAGTLGRALVDGARQISVWGETIAVNATIHTVGGLSAHADQNGLLAWYRGIGGHPPVALVHGEPRAMDSLAQRLHREAGARVTQPTFGQSIEL